jgi:hypothetical protein
MHPSIQNEDELSKHVTSIVQEIMSHGFMSSIVQLEDRELTVIASQGDGTEGNPIVPLFLLPSPEIMLSLTDPETGDHLFKIAGVN